MIAKFFPNEVDKQIDINIEQYEKIIASSPLDEAQKELVIGSWLNSVKTYEKLTSRNYQFAKWSLIAILIFGATVPPLINLADNCPCLKMIATILSVLVTVLTGMRQGFNYNERWKHFRNMAELLKLEGENFFALSGNYEKLTTVKEALSSFIKNVTAIKNKQVSDYITKVVSKGGDEDLDKKKKA